jgi:hypothetical protein
MINDIRDCPQIVFVIGMGRSGTSLTCQVLEKAGAYFGDPDLLIPADDKNKRGYYEHRVLEAINIQLLKDLFGVTWLFRGPLPFGWWEWDSVKHFEDKAAEHLLINVLEANKRKAPFVFKDARITRLSPMWIRAALKASGQAPTMILCRRHPGEVYLSLYPKSPVARPSESVKHMHKVNHPELHRDDVEDIWADYMDDGYELRDAGYVKTVAVFEHWFNPGKLYRQGKAVTDAAGLDPLSIGDLIKIIDPEMRSIK